jgi:hypothetical protein
MLSYKQLIQTIKASPDGLYFRNLSGDTYNKVSRLIQAGCIDIEPVSEGEFKHRLVATVKRNQPQPPTPQAETVRVSFWRTGDRAGLFSQQAYEVTARDGEWVTYKNALGQRHTVKAQYTQVAA